MNKLTMSLALVLLGLTSSQAGPDLPGLKAAGPDPSLGSKLALFGQFVGDWKGDIALTNADGSKTVGTFEWHFGWVLEGKAVQDVWKARYSDAKPSVPAIGYGTTFRYYDPQLDAWRVVWVSPHSNRLIVFVARQAGNEIVMEARADQGRQVRWIFSEITPQSFHWRSATSPDGNTSIVSQTMSARRVANTNAEQRTSESDRKAIEALEGEWLKAESDQAALGSILATDFVHPVPPGVFLTKAEHIDWESKPAARNNSVVNLADPRDPVSAIEAPLKTLGPMTTTGFSATNAAEALQRNRARNATRPLVSIRWGAQEYFGGKPWIC